MKKSSVATALCLALAAAPASADSVAATEILLVPPVPATNGYWSAGEPRWFVSTRSEVGTIYAKPYFSAGYGVPHWLWAGVDLNAITTLELGQFAGGLRLATPIIDLTFSARDTWSYNKPLREGQIKHPRRSASKPPRGQLQSGSSKSKNVVLRPRAMLRASVVLPDCLGPRIETIGPRVRAVRISRAWRVRRITLKKYHENHQVI